MSQNKACQLDTDTLTSLLNESREYHDFFKELEEQEDLEQVSSWHQKFSVSIKNGIGSLTASNISQSMREKLSTLKVKFTPIRENDEREATITEFEGLAKGDARKNFTTNLLLNVTRKVQKLVVNHGYAITYLQQVINNLEEKVVKVEENLNNEVIQEQVREEFNQKFQLLEDKVVKLEQEKEVLALEVDKTRQWGMKGNIILSAKRDKQDMLKQVTQGGVKESPSDLCRRLIQQETGVEVKEEDILACHPMGKEGNRSFIIKIHNHKVGTGWETLVAGMTSGSTAAHGNFKKTGVFLNFQLTDRRRDLLWNVRKAKSAQKILKFKVDQNGRILVSKVKGKAGDFTRLPWHEITDFQKLREVCPDMEFPVPQQQQQPRQQQGQRN